MVFGHVTICLLFLSRYCATTTTSFQHPEIASSCDANGLCPSSPSLEARAHHRQWAILAPREKHDKGSLKMFHTPHHATARRRGLAANPAGLVSIMPHRTVSMPGGGALSKPSHSRSRSFTTRSAMFPSCRLHGRPSRLIRSHI